MLLKISKGPNLLVQWKYKSKIKKENKKIHVLETKIIRHEERMNEKKRE